MSCSSPLLYTFIQRVLNDLWRTRLSCRRMIWLLPRPLPPSPVNKLSLFLSLPVCCRSSLLTGERGRVWGRAKSYNGEKASSSINHSILWQLFIIFHKYFSPTGYSTYFSRTYQIFLYNIFMIYLMHLYFNSNLTHCFSIYAQCF